MSAAVITSLASSFGVMLIGLYVSKTGWLSDPQRKGVALLYSSVVFPTMVFKGVAAIDVRSIDMSLGLVVLLSKAALALIVVAYGVLTLRGPLGGTGAALANAAAFAMAASHSFDVTLGVPLAKELYPSTEAYVYLNQSIQLVIINPVLLMLMDVGEASSKGSTASGTQVLRKAMLATMRNPLVVLTAAGIAASQIFPAGLPAVLAALATQVSQAGPCLGFLSLGFALGALGGTTRSEAAHAAVLCGAKLALMPWLYRSVAGLVGCTQSEGFLTFLGALPASASVYSLCLTRQLSPRVVGPLVPTSMLLSVVLALAPLFPGAAEARVAELTLGATASASVLALGFLVMSSPSRTKVD